MKRPGLKAFAVTALALLIAAGGLLPCLARAGNDISNNPHVLFLSSYSYEWESVPKQLNGLEETLNGYALVDYLFMDTKRQDYDDVKLDVYNHIRSLEEKDEFDYVIAGDDAALVFVLEYREELFADTPIVFEGINDEDFAREAAQDALITGIVETFPLKETIALAEKIYPDAVRVVGITDGTTSGKGSTKQFMNCAESFPGLEFSLIDCSALTLDEIGAAVKDCGEDTILIYLMMVADAQDNRYSNIEAVEYVTSHASIPTFKADELGVGNGILGGVVVSYYDMAAQAADIVLSLSRGADISDYDVQIAESYCVFDVSVMDAFGLTKAGIYSAHPESIKFINDEQTYFQQHRKVILPLSIVIALLTAFAVVVSVSSRRRRDLLKRLTERDMMLNNLLDNIPGGLAIYRIGGVEQDAIKTMYTSRGVPKLTGRTMDEYLEWIDGGLFENTACAEDLPELERAAAECLPLRKPIYLHYRIRHKDGSLVPVTLSAVWAYDDEKGNMIYFAVYMDATEQEKARRAEQAAMEAEASNAAKSEFLSRMSHDIRTPLNAVLGFASLAADEPDVPEKVGDYLQKINVSGKYLLGLINDVLDMAKIESGKVELREENVDGPSFLALIAEVFGAQAQERGVKLITDFSESQTPWVVMDTLRTRQIYANLLSNAIKFSQSGTEVRWTIRDIPTGPDSFHMICTVSDQGCGMSEEFMERMFKPFEQDRPDDAYKGTGLGLPIVKSLVELMGGTISVQSELGKGSTFTVELDRKCGVPVEAHIAAGEGESETALMGRRILMCEDNHVNTVVATRLLEKEGCTVESAADGSLGLAMFTQYPPGYYDAVLMDVRMPVMDGLRTAQAIRALQRPDAATVPIIAMSANAFAEDIQKSLDAGMDAHLSKPIEPELLYKTLAEMIGKRRKDADERV